MACCPTAPAARSRHPTSVWLCARGASLLGGVRIILPGSRELPLDTSARPPAPGAVAHDEFPAGHRGALTQVAQPAAAAAAGIGGPMDPDTVVLDLENELPRRACQGHDDLTRVGMLGDIVEHFLKAAEHGGAEPLRHFGIG